MGVGPTTAFYDSRCCLNREREREKERERENSLSLTRWNETNRDWTVDGGMERNGTSTHTICNWLAGWLTDRLYRQTDKWNAILNLLVAFCRNSTQPKRNRQRSRTGGGIGRGRGRGRRTGEGTGTGTNYIYYFFSSPAPSTEIAEVHM